MGKVKWLMQVATYMKAYGRMTNEMGQVLTPLKKAEIIKGSGKMII